MAANPNLCTGGFDAPPALWPGVVSHSNFVRSTLTANQHVDATGDLYGGGAWEQAYTHTYYHEPLASIPWEDVLAETNLRWRQYTPVFALKNGSTILCGIRVGNLQVITRRGSTDITATDVSGLDSDHGRYLSMHAVIDASAGTLKVWVDGTAIVEETGQNTAQSTSGVTRVSMEQINGYDRAWWDDYIVRPRTILIDGVTSAKSATPSGTLTGGTGGETATVYGWQNDTTDSEGGAGDPALGSQQWRLFLKNCSIAPDDYGATGFVDGESITVTGLAGTLVVDAPNAAYQMGLEPHSMLYMQSFHHIGQAPSSSGTEDSDGTLIGTPLSNRLAALTTVSDGEGVRHSTAGESVTVGVSALSSAQLAAIDRVVGVQVTVAGTSAGTSPNSLEPRLLDNGTNAQAGASTPMGATTTTATAVFDLNGSGAPWGTGSGAGNVDSREPGYEIT